MYRRRVVLRERFKTVPWINTRTRQTAWCIEYRDHNGRSWYCFRSRGVGRRPQLIAYADRREAQAWIRRERDGRETFVALINEARYVADLRRRRERLKVARRG